MYYKLVGFTEHEEMYSKMIREGQISRKTALKRSALMDAGGYLSELRWAADFFAHYVIALRYGICYIPEILYIARDHQKQYGRPENRVKSEDREVIESMIKKIIHLSDIHIRTIQLHDLYRRQFEGAKEN